MKSYNLEIDDIKTNEALSSPELRGKQVEEGKLGYTITFIGPEGKVLKQISGRKGTYKINPSKLYVRAKVTFTRKHPADGMEEYYAWGQPVFMDGQAK